MTTRLGSVVIAAKDEEDVIARTLRHLQEVVEHGIVDVIVVCNGCTDGTAEVARGFSGVRVRELPLPSKTAALREGDRVAVAGPRIYLDADVELTGRAAVATLRALADGACAARPPYRFEVAGSHRIVRRWYAVRELLPSTAHALWGAGCYALSVEGRARFRQFPEVEADDLFVDSLFTANEVDIVATDPVVIHVPRNVGDLIRILRRHYRTQPPAPDRVHGAVLSSSQREQLRDARSLLRHEPARIGDVAVYVAIIVLARLRARFGPSPRWERDMSSRRAG